MIAILYKYRFVVYNVCQMSNELRKLVLKTLVEKLGRTNCMTIIIVFKTL